MEWKKEKVNGMVNENKKVEDLRREARMASILGDSKAFDTAVEELHRLGEKL